MPRFQIKRKTKQVKPEVVVEEKIDDTEMSLESSSESEEEIAPQKVRFATLNLNEIAPEAVEEETEPEYAPQRRPRETSVAQRHVTPVRNRNNYERRPPPLRRMCRDPRPIQYPRPSRSANGRPHLQFVSGYGPNSSHMTTQDKARRLYNSCFG
jgi:hypothetical protein